MDSLWAEAVDLEGSCSVNLTWAPCDEKNQRTTRPSWIPILPLLSWYQSSLVFLAQVLPMPWLLARGAEGQVAGRALHWHRCSRLARCDVAHCLAVGCGAPCSLGVQVDFWNATERETKLFIQSPSLSSDMCLSIQHPSLHKGVGAKALRTHAHGHLGPLFFSQVCICALLSSCTESIATIEIHYTECVSCLFIGRFKIWT